MAGTAIRAAIKAADARLCFLPPYWPDPNPIEQACDKIKQWMRSTQMPTLDETRRRIGNLVTTIEAAECSNYFANAACASV